MALTAAERKERLVHGAITKIARKTKRSIGHVSQVMAGDRDDPKVWRVAARMLGMTEEEAGFSPADTKPAEPERVIA